MADSIQDDLQVPDIDWAHYDAGGSIKQPPQAKGPDGRYKTYYVQLPQEFAEDKFGKTQQGYLKVGLAPITFVNNGEGVDGYTIKFDSQASASAKQYQTREGKMLEASQLGNFLISADVAQSMQPKDLEGYKQAVRATAGKIIPVLVEWELYDKTTKTRVYDKYDEFPGDAGNKSSVITTADGRTLIARAKIKGFVTPRA